MVVNIYMCVINWSLLISSIGVIILLYVCINICFYINKVIKRCAAFKELPGDPPHWFWGSLRDIPNIRKEEGLKLKRDRTRRYPDWYVFWVGPFIPSLSVTSPQAARPIVKSAQPKGNIYRLLQPWLGDGLLLSNGEKWARNRRLLTPAFHFEMLKSYLSIKNIATDKLCSKISQFAESGEYFEECYLIKMFTLDIILQCAFSYKTNCQDIGVNHPYVMAVGELERISVDRFLKPWLYIDWIFNLTANGQKFKKHCDHVHKIAEDIIAQRKNDLDAIIFQENKQQTRCKDFLDILLRSRDENGIGLTDSEIRDEVDTFLFTGHDTTASAISWALYSLAQHPQIQDTVQQEIDRQSDDLLTSDISQLPYLTMCIKESLRLHTTVSFLQRQSDQEIQIFDKTIPKDTMISVYIYLLHHNPAVWENSLEFRPERFSRENIEKMDPFAFIPFSAGSRNCIGQNFAMHELKVTIFKILHRFSLEVDPNHDVRHLEGLVMKAEHGIKLKVTHRKTGEYRLK